VQSTIGKYVCSLLRHLLMLIYTFSGDEESEQHALSHPDVDAVDEALGVFADSLGLAARCALYSGLKLYSANPINATHTLMVKLIYDHLEPDTSIAFKVSSLIPLFSRLLPPVVSVVYVADPRSTCRFNPWSQQSTKKSNGSCTASTPESHPQVHPSLPLSRKTD
jgi:hypothetical protein